MDEEDSAQKDDGATEDPSQIALEEITKRMNEVKIEATEGLRENEQKFEKTGSVSDMITGAKPKERSGKPHSQLDNLRKEKSTSQAAVSKELDQDAEISILKKKLRLELGGPQGFMHEIDQKEYVKHNVSESWDSEFSSEKERMETQKNMTSTNSAASGFVGPNIPDWGLGLGVGGGGGWINNSGSRSDTQRKTKVAILTRTNSHLVRKFRVKTTLSEMAMEEAKAILKDPNQVVPFTEKYGSYIYTGIFAAGGWFRTIATAESSEDMEFEVLAKEARRKLEGTLSVGFASESGAVKVGMGLKGSNTEDKSEDSNLQMNQSSVNVSTKKESSPGNTESPDELEIKITNAENWTVLPANISNPENKKNNYFPIHEVLKIQADDMKDYDLKKAAEIIKEKMSLSPTKPPTTRQQPSIPKTNPDWTYKFKLIIVGDSGVGKSSLISRFQSQGLPEVIQSTITGTDCCFLSVKAGETYVDLEILDTAGQERFLALTRSFYRDRVGAFLVYDITKRETFDNLDRWLNELREHNEKIVIMLIGNKYDLAEMGAARAVKFDEGKEFAKQRGLTGGNIETSARNDGLTAGVPMALAERICAEIEKKRIDPSISHNGIQVNVEMTSLTSPQHQHISQLQQRIKLLEERAEQQKKKSCCSGQAQVYIL